MQRFVFTCILLFFSRIVCMAGVDLSIAASVLNSTNVEVGNTISIGFVLKNTGNQNSTISYTGFYLSADAQLDSADTYLSSLNNAGLSYNTDDTVHNQSVSIPQSVIPGNYFLIIKADYDADVSEDNENNNVQNIILLVQPGFPRDLAISLNTSSTSVELGNIISFQFSLSNAGAGSIGPNYTGLFLSSNTLLDNNDISLNYAMYSGGLSGNQTISYAQTTSVPLYVTPGTYYLILKADINGNILETDETNNIVSVSLTILPNSGNHDLLFNSYSIPTNFEKNKYTYCSFTIGNNGTSACMPSSMAFFISSDATLDGGDLLVSSTMVYGIAGNSSDNENVSIKIPSSISTGNYYLLVKLDNGATITETNENNNIVSKAIVVVASQVDMTVVTASTSNGTVQIGNLLSVAFTIKNLGTVNPGYVYTNFFLSSDPVVDAGDINLGYQANYVNSSGVNISGSFSGVVSSSVALGNYYLIVYTDYYNYVNEYNESNNQWVLASNIIIQNPGSDVDLSISDLINMVTSFEAGQLASGSMNIANTGSSPALSSNEARLYFSSDNVLDVTDSLLATIDIYPMYGSETAYYQIGYKIPGNIAPGTYYMISQVDPLDIQSETNEVNNVLIVPISVIATLDRDLTITQLTSNETTVEVTSEIMVNYTFENIGTADAEYGEIGFYLSQDVSFDPTQDILIGSNYYFTMLAGASEAAVDFPLYIPGETPAGNYYMIAVADEYDYIPESNESNNIQYLSIAITALDIDLTVSSIALSSNVIASSAEADLDFTVNNSGATGADYHRCSIFLSEDNVLDPSDIVLNDFLYVPEILPGSSFDFTDISITIPGETPAGTYYLLIMVDPDSIVFETVENNNVNYVIVTITGTPMPDAIVSFYSMVNTNILVGGEYDVTYSVKNIGNDDNFSYSYASIYLSSDSAFDGSDEMLFADFIYLNLASGDSIILHGSYFLPEYYPEGEYYSILVADDYDMYSESNEDNNLQFIKIMVTNTLSVHDSWAKEAEFNIYPVPASDKITFDTSEHFNESLEIINSQGAVVMKLDLSGSTTLTLEEFTSGVYFVKGSEGVLGQFVVSK